MAKLDQISAPQRRNFKPVDAAMIGAVGISVGRIVAKVDQLGLGDNTLIVLISDNGGLPSVSQLDPLRGSKGSLFEAGFREDNTVALYHLEVDPGEQQNLAVTMPEVAAKLRAEMDTWQSDTKAPIPTKLNLEYDQTAKVPVRKRASDRKRDSKSQTRSKRK